MTTAAAIEVPLEDKLLKQFQDIYFDYLRSIGAVWDTTTRQIMETQVGYMSRCQNASSAESATQDYVKAVCSTWDTAQKGYADAYTKFLQSHRDAWSRVDVPKLSPWAMSFIAASAQSAAAHAGATIGNWWLIANAGVPPAILGMTRST